jgi:PAS domain S-box-containing protein
MSEVKDPAPLLLVLEDEAVVSMELEARLTGLGYRVLGPCSTVEQAFALARKERPDLLLADIRLEGEQDGIDAARRLRDELSVPTVYLSAHTDRATLERAIATDPFGYLTKPFREAELHATLRTALHRDRLERTLAARERSLGRSEARFRALFEGSPDALLVIGAEGTIALVNAATERLFGYTRDELLGKRVDELVPERLRDQHAQHRLRFLASHDARIMGSAAAVYGLTKQGREVPLEIGLSQAPFGEESCTLVAARDMTAKKRAEAELQRSREALFLSQKLDAVGRLAGGVAHDFNNLLTVILGLSQVLTRTLSDQEHPRSLAKDIHEAGTRAQALVCELLAFAQKGPVRRTTIDLNSCIDAFSGLLRRTLPQNIELGFELCADECKVCMDPLHVEQVLLNLTLNARDAMPSGGRLWVRTRLADVSTPAAAQPGYELEVEDEGCGIPQELSDHIFEPFFTTKEFGRGTGLGLSTVYGVVTQAGGTIRVHSREGHGTTFRIWLPAHPGAPEPTCAEEGRAQR